MTEVTTANSERKLESNTVVYPKRTLDVLSVVFQSLVLVVAFLALGPLGSAVTHCPAAVNVKP